MSPRQKTTSRGKSQRFSVAALIAQIEEMAPLRLAASWDKVGLQVGDADRPVSKAMLCIDLTEPVLAEAVRKKVQLIISYHPLIFEPLSAVTVNTWKQRLVLRAIEAGIAVYSPHTALDAAEGGVNDWLALGAGPGESTTIADKDDDLGQQFKIVTFVPHDALDKVRSAMAGAGAGQIGAYSECSFTVDGTGTFQGDPTTNPTVGEAGRFERAAEKRLEMIVDWPWVTDVYFALLDAHPYEEPAIDVYNLVDLWSSLPGIGRINWLDRPVSLDTLVKRFKKHLGLSRLKVAKASGQKKFERVAVCAGAGGSLLDQVIGQGADVFVTGEMRHHDVLDAVAKNVSIILAGHTNTERPYLPHYQNRLAQLTGKKVQWVISTADKAPADIV